MYMYTATLRLYAYSCIDSHVPAGCTLNYELSPAAVLHLDLFIAGTFSHSPHHLCNGGTTTNVDDLYHFHVMSNFKLFELFYLEYISIAFDIIINYHLRLQA